MLDLKGLVATQKQGIQVMGTLKHDEMVVLQNYALVAAQEIYKAGSSAQQSTSNIVLNAFRSGIALGLGIEVVAGKVSGRRRS